MKKLHWLLPALVFIASVSAFDSYRCVIDSEHLLGVELNPLARLLITGDDVSLLIGAKSFGAGAVVGVLCEINHSNYKHAPLITWAIVATQVAVLCSYLL